MGKKLDKLLKQSEEQLQKLNGSSKQLRAHVFGQDRYWRRYWELPCSGGIYVEAMESAEPEILDLQAELDEKYKNMPIEEKPEVKQEDVKMDTENRENEAPNEVKEERTVNAHKEEESLKPLEEKAKFEVEEVNCKKEEKVNCIAENSKYHADDSKNDLDSSMTDVKTNVTSDEIKQETEIKMDVDIKADDMKKENEDTDKKGQKPVSKIIDDKIVGAIPNGDKFNHVNNLHNGKDVNGTFISGKCLLIEITWILLFRILY